MYVIDLESRFYPLCVGQWVSQGQGLEDVPKTPGLLCACHQQNAGAGLPV